MPEIKQPHVAQITGGQDADGQRIGIQPQGRFRLLLRLCALSGVVGPILFILVFTVDGSLSRGYSAIQQPISSLEAAGEPHAWIQNTNLVVFCLLLIAFAIGFSIQMAGVLRRGWLGASILLLLFTGIGMIASGVFTVERPGQILAFTRVYCGLHLAHHCSADPWVHLRQSPGWRGYGQYSIITALLAIGDFIALAMAANPLHMRGLFQRLLVMCAFSWYECWASGSFLWPGDKSPFQGFPAKCVAHPLDRQGRRGRTMPLYEIRLQGLLDRHRSAWFDGLAITYDGDDTTLLRGPLADEPALHGVLTKVRDLALPLLAVKRIEMNEPEC